MNVVWRMVRKFQTKKMQPPQQRTTEEKRLTIIDTQGNEAASQPGGMTWDSDAMAAVRAAGYPQHVGGSVSEHFENTN